MTTRIADIYVPQPWNMAVGQVADGLYTLLASGAVVADARLNAFLAGGGSSIDLPLFGAVDGAATWNVSNDNPADIATPDGLGSAPQSVPRLARNAWFAEMNLARELAGQAALAEVQSKLGDAVNKNRQAALISILGGVFDPTAGIYNSLVSYGGAADFNVDMLANAGVKFDGRLGNELLITNPTTYSQMQKEVGVANTTIPMNGLDIAVSMYGGHPVVVDKAVPANTTYMCKPGSIAVGSNGVSTDTERAPLAGNGSGQESIGVRESIAYGILGASYTGNEAVTSPGVGAPSNAELGTAANWAQISTLTDLSKVGIVVISQTVAP